MQDISRRSVRCLANPGKDTSLHFWRSQLPPLCSSSLQVSSLMCIQKPEGDYPRRNVRQKLGKPANQTLQYSYKLPTSTPMTYPKCEMNFPKTIGLVWLAESVGVGLKLVRKREEWS